MQIFDLLQKAYANFCKLAKLWLGKWMSLILLSDEHSNQDWTCIGMQNGSTHHLTKLCNPGNSWFWFDHWKIVLGKGKRSMTLIWAAKLTTAAAQSLPMKGWSSDEQVFAVGRQMAMGWMGIFIMVCGNRCQRPWWESEVSTAQHD